MQKTMDATLKEAVALLKKENPQPVAAIVLGSGVSVLDKLEDAKTYTYDRLFGIKPTVEGHTGSLTIGGMFQPGASAVAVFRGRFHLYEGHDWDTVTLPARLVAALAIPRLILTNAAGGLNRQFKIGDLMVLTGYRDHLSPALGKTGLLPALKKPNTQVNNELTDLLIATGSELAAKDPQFRALRQGTYAALLGPSYETHAEVEMLRRLSADAVGMSTVPELLTVEGTDTQAAAISVITNVWEENTAMGGHKEVLNESKAASLRLDTLLSAIMTRL
ncbi:MAG: purine-nucleoside phosphorylase [Candidatus Obscuribacterales bacterium]|nr:purine-nucleoside phosphorylase [Candidatus Obscuribacterales bacterium]